MTVRSYPLTEEDEEKTKNVWLKGHTGEHFALIPRQFDDDSRLHPRSR